ncbi:hypothetical protein SMA75_20320 [Escherichia coli]|uniref:hypothetical protein n=1 Tax=Escherichia coli TaxID=562 RepID=UPI0030798DC5
MSHHSRLTAHTREFGDKFARVKTDSGSTGFFLGREFRAWFEIIKAAADTRYFRVTAPVEFILLAQRLTLDSGAARVSAWVNPTFSGTWTPVPIVGRNRMQGALDQGYSAQLVVETALGPTGSFTGGTNTDLLRVRCGANQGNSSSQNVGESSDDYRGLPITTFGIKVEQITGVANTDAVNGVYEIIWEERPQGNIG